MNILTTVLSDSMESQDYVDLSIFYPHNYESIIPYYAENEKRNILRNPIYEPSKIHRNRVDKRTFLWYTVRAERPKGKGHMRILGIDPGYAILGWGVLDLRGNRFSVVDYGAVTTDAGTEMPYRLQHLYTELSSIIEEYRTDAASIEELIFNNNAKTAIMVGQARGVAVLACVNGGLEVNEYTPLQIKQALVGYGRADKKQVQAMVKAILNLKEVPRPDDTADAVAAAICHGHAAGNRVRNLKLGR